MAFPNFFAPTLSKEKDTLQVFTMPNADPGNKRIFDIIDNYVKSNNNAISFNSLGYLRYLSCLQFVDAVVGNSSSGLLEAPTFKIGTINIGDRQKVLFVFHIHTDTGIDRGVESTP